MPLGVLTSGMREKVLGFVFQHRNWLAPLPGTSTPPPPPQSMVNSSQLRRGLAQSGQSPAVQLPEPSWARGWGDCPKHPRACHGTDCQRQRVAGCLLRPSGAGFHHPPDCKASGQGLSPQRGQLRALQKQAVGSTAVIKCWVYLKSQVSDAKSPPAFCSPGQGLWL